MKVRNNGMDNLKCNDAGLRELALFAGAGGGIIGGHLLGWRTVCAVEYNAYARSVLLARQNDGTLAPFPIWDDVRTFDGRPWQGRVDVVSGGFPCQDISCAGKGAGIDGERSGLWSEMARIISEVRPRFTFIENSPMLVNRGLDRVLCDLAAMGYSAKWGIVSAAETGAPHKRERIWIMAYSDSQWELQQEGIVCDEWRRISNGGEDVANALCDEKQHLCDTTSSGFPNGSNKPLGRPKPFTQSERSDWWATEPDVGRVADGVAFRVDRIKSLGNGQVSRVAATAWSILSD